MVCQGSAHRQRVMLKLNCVNSLLNDHGPTAHFCLHILFDILFCILFCFDILFCILFDILLRPNLAKFQSLLINLNYWHAGCIFYALDLVFHDLLSVPVVFIKKLNL